MLDEAFPVNENLAGFKVKFGKEPSFNEYFRKFVQLKKLNKIKHPFNDIERWMNRPFSEFKAFLDKIDVGNKQERRNKRYLETAVEWGAVKFGEFDGYEAWYVPSYQSAVQLARFYCGSSTNWCITTDDTQYFFGNHYRSTFIFLINPSMPARDPNKKLAIELSLVGASLRIIDVYDAEDNYLFTGETLDAKTKATCDDAV